MNGDFSAVDIEADGEHKLRITLELTVEVLDIDALQAAALAALRGSDAGLSEAQLLEQAAGITTDETGASALQWLIQPDHVLALTDHIDEVEPREAVLSVEVAEGVEEEEEEDQ
ncbi:hypothetical protein [Spongiactinospora sp. TRM90649]|uniref:hypothetical protein n=1 Tax=Spongiactinospora sp. TRM90649 TaxID=3031114 RepID=UPI0023F85EE9|nr:hypothetical protein [Spongiactinospora sp. TRM90649]MDF5752512.1 hypothetical protein [Spongiactinospora sp. TRM90649]